jgi:hypothetical protein
MAEDGGVDHGRRDVAVAQELLDGADVVTALQQMSGEGVTERVAAGALVDPGRADGSGHGALHVRLVVMMPAFGGLALPSRQGTRRRTRAATGVAALLNVFFTAEMIFVSRTRG